MMKETLSKMVEQAMVNDPNEVINRPTNNAHVYDQITNLEDSTVKLIFLELFYNVVMCDILGKDLNPKSLIEDTYKTLNSLNKKRLIKKGEIIKYD